jgi:hypothetical protein
MFHEKILYGCDNIDSSLIALGADDDFLFANALTEAATQMFQNSAILISFGEFFYFDSENSSRFYSVDSPNLSAGQLLIGSKFLRLKYFLENYSQILWSLYRKDILKKSFQSVKSANFSNDNFIEYIISCVAISNGHLNFISGKIGVREINPNEHWGTRHSIISNKDTVDLAVFKNEITMHDSIKFAEIALNTLLKRHSIKNKVIQKIKKIFNLSPDLPGKTVDINGDLLHVDNILRDYDNRPYDGRE